MEIDAESCGSDTISLFSETQSEDEKEDYDAHWLTLVKSQQILIDQLYQEMKAIRRQLATVIVALQTHHS